MRPVPSSIMPLLLLFLCSSCVEELDVVTPVADPGFLEGSTEIPDQLLRRIEGVYEVLEGGERFGGQVVLKFDGRTLSIFCQKNVAFMILESGFRDSTFLFTGMWRFAQAVNTGLVSLSILPDNGGRELLRSPGNAKPTLTGRAGGVSRGDVGSPLALRYLRPVKKRIGGFWNIAHRGGGRNSDRHPYSENSLSMLKYAGMLGANGVEVDVRLTKDGIPILFHDEEFSTRLVHGAFMAGPVSNYTYAQITALSRLVNGERIPTLEEALETILAETNLGLVWLDVKDAASIPVLIPMLIRFKTRASELGRKVEAVHGLPDGDIASAFLAHPDHQNVRALSEGDVDEARAVNAGVWAPRWTLGTQNDAVAAMHAEGRSVFVWTLDSPEFMIHFLHDGDFDGILTNYPTLTAYYFYTQI